MPDQLQIEIDGQAVRVLPGTTVAAAIYFTGQLHCRTSVTGEPRGPLCGMGICFECKATVDGRPDRRTCQLLVRDGMVVRTSC